MIHQKEYNIENPGELIRCQRLFKNQDSLKHHMQQHLAKTYTCKVCEMTHQSGNSLKIHYNFKHPDFEIP